MGQNMVGWLSVNLKGKKGKPVSMKFAELLQKDGSLYLANLRTAQVTDIYTPAEDGDFSWQPRFVYHGFRFPSYTYKKQLGFFMRIVNTFKNKLSKKKKLAILFPIFFLIIQRYREKFHSFLLVFRVNILQMRHCSPASTTPGCPKINQYQLIFCQ